MSKAHRRPDLSQFLVHLTRDHGGVNAGSNLRSILAKRQIEARNLHCLASPLIKSLGFSKRFKEQFHTVCLTETPFSKLRHLVRSIPGREVELRPFGLIFDREALAARGANRVHYVNTQFARDELDEFKYTFNGFTQWSLFSAKRGVDRASRLCRRHAIVNRADARYDFSWEREWRHVGNLHFEFADVIAIIAPSPTFVDAIPHGPLKASLKRIPIVDIKASVEDMICQLSAVQWSKTQLMVRRAKAL